jgi:hypothetical protein
MKTYLLNAINRQIEFYHLLSEDLVLLIDKDAEYCILKLNEEVDHNINFKVFPFRFDKVQNLRVEEALPYFAIAEDYAQKGLVLSIDDPQYYFPFERGDYHVKHCCFPLALYKKDEQYFLLHGSDWNRIEQICLTTKNAMIPPFSKNDEEKEIDYFHSSIQLSPNKKEFLSNGWVWQPYDIIYRFKLEDMQAGKLNDFQDIQIPIGTGYNWDRPLCWINNNLIAIGYNPREDEEETYAEDTPSQILIYDLSDDSISKKISANCFALTDYGEVWGELYYHKQLDAFISLNTETGLQIIGRNGQLLHRTMAFKEWKYSPALDLFYILNPSNELRILPTASLLKQE